MRSTCRWQTNGTTWITEFRHTWRISDKKHWSYSGCSLWNNTLRSVFTSVYSLRCHSELLFTVLSEHVCADQILCNDFFFFCCAAAELIVRATTDIICTLLPKGNERRSDITGSISSASKSSKTKYYVTQFLFQSALKFELIILFLFYMKKKTKLNNLNTFRDHLRISEIVDLEEKLELETSPVLSVCSVNADLYCRALWAVDKVRKQNINVHQPFMSEVLLNI